jgi:hypothetical protein
MAIGLGEDLPELCQWETLRESRWARGGLDGLDDLASRSSVVRFVPASAAPARQLQERRYPDYGRRRGGQIG